MMKIKKELIDYLIELQADMAKNPEKHKKAYNEQEEPPLAHVFLLGEKDGVIVEKFEIEDADSSGSCHTMIELTPTILAESYIKMVKRGAIPCAIGRVVYGVNTRPYWLRTDSKKMWKELDIPLVTVSVYGEITVSSLNTKKIEFEIV